MELHSKGNQFSIFLIPVSDFRLGGVRFSDGITFKSVFFKIAENFEKFDRVAVRVVDERAATRWGWARKFTTGLWCGRKVRIRGTGEIIRRAAAEISNDK